MTVQEIMLIEALSRDAVADLKRGEITAYSVEVDEQMLSFTITKRSPLLGEKKPYAKGLISRKDLFTRTKVAFIAKQAHVYYRTSMKVQLEETYLKALRENGTIVNPDEAKFIRSLDEERRDAKR